MSCWIESMYSCSSLTGLVSSKRRWQRPPNSRAIPKLSAIALGWPMWRYPFGSGGKRVTTSETLPSRTSAATISRMKSLRSGVAGLWALTPLLLIVSKTLVQHVAMSGRSQCQARLVASEAASLRRPQLATRPRVTSPAMHLLGRIGAAADRVTTRLTLLGADPRDGDDLRARKALLVLISVLI